MSSESQKDYLPNQKRNQHRLYWQKRQMLRPTDIRIPVRTRHGNRHAEKLRRQIHAQCTCLKSFLAMSKGCDNKKIEN